MQSNGDANRVEIVGTVVEAPKVRYSPAGIPIARFLLEHSSEQMEAGTRRQLSFRVGVRAAGTSLVDVVNGLPAGSDLRVMGHLARARQRAGDTRLIISAARIERLSS
ncbi:MAG: primosomal replication protein N [Ectothiorhodospiraceae bacterium]|jgi:primosomal replication protein N